MKHTSALRAGPEDEGRPPPLAFSEDTLTLLQSSFDSATGLSGRRQQSCSPSGGEQVRRMRPE